VGNLQAANATAVDAAAAAAKAAAFKAKAAENAAAAKLLEQKAAQAQTKAEAIPAKASFMLFDVSWAARDKKRTSPLFELTRLFVRVDHIARVIVNTDNCIM